VANQRHTETSLQEELEDLRRRLQEAEEVLNAIRDGEVDGVIVSDSRGDRIYTLQGADHTYRTLVEQMSEGALVLTSDGIILYANRRVAEFLQAPLEQVIGARLCRLVVPEDVTKCRQLCAADDPGVQAEISLLRADASRLPVLLSLSAALEDGVKTLFAVMTDLTEQKRNEEALRRAHDSLEQRVRARTAELQAANDDLQREVRERRRVEEALRQSEERFRQLAENIDDVFWIKDRDSKSLLYLSPAFEHIWERPRAPYIERFSRYLDHVHPDDRDRLKAANAKVIDNIQAGTAAFVEEYRIVMPDGRVRWMLSRAFPVFDENGDAYRLAGVTEDITDQKDAEDRLLQYSEQLEVLVEQRTAQVRDLEAQRASMEHLAAAGRMAARVAHEINNPLAGIKNAFLLLRDAIPQDHKYAHYVPRIQQEIDRIATVVRQMFELCQPADEDGDKATVDRVLKDLLALHELGCRKRGVSLDLDLDPAIAQLTFPGATLRQVLYPLIQNAIDVSPAGGHVRIAVEPTDTAEVRFAVTDEGPGIPDDRLPFIFQPFYTTKTSHRGSGLGLGLSICRTLVEKMCGSLTYARPPAGGSRFTVQLPLAVENPCREPSTPESASL
jgi:two-component system sporulation sensor kinase C